MMEDSVKTRQTQEAMAKLSESIKSQLPEDWGFFVLVAPFGQDAGRANYASTMDRTVVFALMKEFLIRHQQGDDWMKHVD